MKILYHHRTISKDGQDVHIQELIAALERRGHQVIVVAPPVSREAPFGFDGGTVSKIRRTLPRWLAEVAESAYSVPAWWRLMRAWKQHRPDLLYERYNLFLLAGLWLKARTGIPLLLEVNSPLCRERSLHGGLALPRLARWVERRTWGGADAVLPVTNVLADEIRAAGVPGGRIHVIPNGIDPRRMRPTDDVQALRRSLGLEGRLILGFSGFVRPWHGLADALDAMAGLPGRERLHLLVVGDGEARPAIEARAATLGLADQVTFLGIVARDQVSRYVSAFDIALQPKVVEYASPLKLFEYMALGRAIVAPDQPNIREVLTHGRDALLFAPGDVAALRAAIGRLCTDGDLRRRLGEAARQTIDSGSYTWDANACRVEMLARQLVTERRHGLGALPIGDV